MSKDILYIKGDKNVEVKKPDVTLGDILSMECSNLNIVPKVKSLRLFKIYENTKRSVSSEQNMAGKGSTARTQNALGNKKTAGDSYSSEHQKCSRHRYVVSVLKIIECIHQSLPELEVQNMGEMDIIVTYEANQPEGPMMNLIKTGFVALIVFFGAAFSIMAFNNDVSVPKMFGQIYELLTGEQSSGFTILEVTYSIGLIIGILVFFNHFGKKRFSVDPTPIEVEMRLYENDIQTTLIEEFARKKREMDAGEGEQRKNTNEKNKLSSS